MPPKKIKNLVKRKINKQKRKLDLNKQVKVWKKQAKSLFIKGLNDLKNSNSKKNSKTILNSVIKSLNKVSKNAMLYYRIQEYINDSITFLEYAFQWRWVFSHKGKISQVRDIHDMQKYILKNFIKKHMSKSGLKRFLRLNKRHIRRSIRLLKNIPYYRKKILPVAQDFTKVLEKNVNKIVNNKKGKLGYKLEAFDFLHEKLNKVQGEISKLEKKFSQKLLMEKDKKKAREIKNSAIKQLNELSNNSFPKKVKKFALNSLQKIQNLYYWNFIVLKKKGGATEDDIKNMVRLKTNKLRHESNQEIAKKNIQKTVIGLALAVKNSNDKIKLYTGKVITKLQNKLKGQLNKLAKRKPNKNKNQFVKRLNIIKKYGLKMLKKNKNIKSQKKWMNTLIQKVKGSLKSKSAIMAKITSNPHVMNFAKVLIGRFKNGGHKVVKKQNDKMNLKKKAAKKANKKVLIQKKIQKLMNKTNIKKAPVVVKKAPVVVKKAPVVVKTAPVVVKAAPVVVKAAPVVVKKAPVVVKAAPVVIKKAPVVIKKKVQPKIIKKVAIKVKKVKKTKAKKQTKKHYKKASSKKI